MRIVESHLDGAGPALRLAFSCCGANCIFVKRVFLTLAALAAVMGVSGCGETQHPAAQRVIKGDSARGRAVIASVGCGACHEIPGLAGARGIVGPSLAGFARRSYITGGVANRPEELARFVRDAPGFSPVTAMPAMPVSEAEARDVAAFLYTLR
jgi:mono/diheme cytochrome c family protein